MFNCDSFSRIAQEKVQSEQINKVVELLKNNKRKFRKLSRSKEQLKKFLVPKEEAKMPAARKRHHEQGHHEAERHDLL